jgi:hypothetical protein
MEVAYLHVVTNHLPIFGVPLALALLLFGLWDEARDRDDDGRKRNRNRRGRDWEERRA